MAKIATLAALLFLGGCAVLREPPMPGEPAGAVLTRMGQPTAVYPLPDGGKKFEYTQQPMGQFAYMATFSPDGRVVAWEQVLTGEKFATIPIDKATKEDVLRTVGHPAEVSRVAYRGYEVWSYRYKEAGVWNSMMHVHFDERGIVRQMINGPDPRYDDRFRNFW